MGDSEGMRHDLERLTHQESCAPANELTEAIRYSLRVGDFRSGELLAQAQVEILKEGELFERWVTFENFVVGALRISKSSAYRKIFAFEFVSLLKSLKDGPALSGNE